MRRLSESVAKGGLRVALTGTPVLNHAEELISQLRIIGRLDEFGCGARFSRQFQGVLTEERLHWHLRRSCFVRRLKSEVLPQLPAKRRVVVPVSLDNEREYRVAERDVVEWLRSQPLELSDLNAKIAATLRAERLAQLGALQRLAARGKLHAALAWIHDFLASGEPLVVFARHREIQEAVLERFPDALHLFGRDKIEAREESVREFQEPGGPQLIVCATRVAAQGITLTRASNVAFLELEWTPALHDQAEDRTHRIGQTDSVTAWYLLAAETIDETMAELVERKRGIVDAVTDGKTINDENVVAGVIRSLRGEEPYRHLRPVAKPSGASRRCGLLGHPLGRDADDVPRQPGLLQPADDETGEVELPARQTVAGRGREGVVVVVPRLAEGERRQPPDVARLVGRVEAAAAGEVADRVDGVGDVVDDEHPHAAAPQQAGQARRAPSRPAPSRPGSRARDRRAPRRGRAGRWSSSSARRAGRGRSAPWPRGGCG